LGDKEPRTPHEGEVFYKDDAGAICRRWNWREAERTKLTERTKNAVLVLEGLPPVTRADIETATKELAELVARHCGGECAHQVLDASSPAMEI
jgi:DNA/RNA-binding domain of Phe-tRNA-synthetase-like protein